jgi:hypothetical protein
MYQAPFVEALVRIAGWDADVAAALDRAGIDVFQKPCANVDSPIELTICLRAYNETDLFLRLARALRDRCAVTAGDVLAVSSPHLDPPAAWLRPRTGAEVESLPFVRARPLEAL